MKELFEEIREQIHDIRNMIAPFDLQMANLDHQIAAIRVSFESKMTGFESRLTANSSQLIEQALSISGLLGAVAQLSERLHWIEFSLKVPQRPGTGFPAPVHEDKPAAIINPPQKPAN
ncbi:MAG TPA: hypothetical protein VMF08_13105 [Candidatus Sulfotelmatobacter sp.]|nr:hypothetical protein [Candidatus Sulfotelmatobacter sp.]